MNLNTYCAVVKISFAERNYHVLQLRCLETQEYITAKGIISDPCIGNIYYFELEPRRATSEKEGSFFTIRRYDVLTRKHLEENPELVDVFFDSFLEKEHVNFVTEKILETYGTETPDIILYQIEKLDKVFDDLGLDENVRRTYITKFKMDFIGPASWALLDSMMVKEDRSHLVVDRFEYNFFKELKKNPYILSILGGVPVKTVDNLDISVDIHHDSDDRFSGFICNFADKESFFRGHMYVKEKDLFMYMKNAFIKGISNQGDSRTKRTLDDLENKGYISRSTIQGSKVYSTEYVYHIEDTISKKLSFMVNNPSSIQFDKGKILERFKLLYSIAPTDSQESILDTVNDSDVLVLTGKAGTGKTTAVNLAVSMLEQCGTPYALLSTTGKAAKVLAKSTDRPSKTVHSYLGFTGSGFTKTDPEERFLVVDEASMMDSYLAYGLLKTIVPGTKILFVGDNNQLPPVGPGGILDVLCDLKKVPIVELDIVHRQSQQSEILKQALRVLGKRSYQDIKDSPDYKYICSSDPKYVRESLLQVYKKTGKDCLVLSPMRKGSFGVVSVNKFLQSKLNKNSLDENTPWFRNDNYEFFEKDKVIIIKNDWNLGVCNGDIGTIESITEEYVSITLESDEVKVMTINKASYSLELAYCLTIHKSQGSEYDVVCVVLQKDHQRMLSTNLIYTAFTRASKKLLVFSDEFARTFRTNESGKKVVKNSWVRELFPGYLKTVAQETGNVLFLG